MAENGKPSEAAVRLATAVNRAQLAAMLKLAGEYSPEEVRVLDLPAEAIQSALDPLLARCAAILHDDRCPHSLVGALAPCDCGVSELRAEYQKWQRKGAK